FLNSDKHNFTKKTTTTTTTTTPSELPSPFECFFLPTSQPRIKNSTMSSMSNLRINPSFQLILHHLFVETSFLMSVCLGEGTTGCVVNAVNSTTSERCAIKIIPNSKIRQFHREKRALSVLQGQPNIITLLKAVRGREFSYLFLSLGGSTNLYSYILRYEHE